MSIAKVTEITAESADGFEAAVRDGITRASQTINNIRSVWIKEHEVVMSDNKRERYRVTMKVTFVLNE